MQVVAIIHDELQNRCKFAPGSNSSLGPNYSGDKSIVMLCDVPSVPPEGI